MFELYEQEPHEAAWMAGQLRGVRSVLEIGSRRGCTLRLLAHACGAGAKVRSIEIAAYGGPIGSRERAYAGDGILSMIERLRDEGFNAKCLIADSHSSEAIWWAKKEGPFDFIFIDGDHDYDAVKADWLNYRPLAAKMVGFHDIAHTEHGVKQLWSEICAQGWSTTEFAVPDSYMGVGIVYVDDALRRWAATPITDVNDPLLPKPVS